MSNFLTFVWGVITSWFGLIGAATIVAGVIQYLTKTYFRPKAWIAAGIILYFIASYQTWLDQRTSYMAERCKVEKFEDRSAAKDQLASFMKEADDLSSVLTKESSAEDVKTWFSNENDWEWKVYTWTRDNLGGPAATKVIDKAAQ
jgi:hypothetical protein